MHDVTDATTKTRSRRRRKFTVAVLVLALLIPATIAVAHTVKQDCASSTIRADESASIGSTKRTVHGDDGNTNIRYNLSASGQMSGCSQVWPGGVMYINTVKCTTTTQISSERTFDDYWWTSADLDNDIATSVIAGTCFRLRWRGGDGNGGDQFQGTLTWTGYRGD